MVRSKDSSGLAETLKLLMERNSTGFSEEQDELTTISAKKNIIRFISRRERHEITIYSSTSLIQ
jgi:hypothetical protein